ncbi:hypothetical protein Tco_0027097 [Tanacetum coccineum]
MARQCTQPKRPRNAAWFKDKLMLAEAQEAGQILDEEQLAFLANPGISEVPVAQQTIPQNSTFQTNDLNAYDSDCDDLSSAKAILMENLSSCDPEVLSKVPYSNSYSNDMINQDVQEMQYSEQTHVDDFQDNEIHSESKEKESLRFKCSTSRKVFAITTLKNKLRKLKGKNVVNTAVSKPNATIAPGMFKLDLEPISPRLKNNRDAHETDSLNTKDSNKPLLTSTRVKLTTSASGSKPPGNTKNNRITRPPRSNKTNKVEDHSRKVKSSLNKMNYIFEPISNALVKHFVRNAKFESICAICCPDHPLVFGLQMFKTYDREPLSAHELLQVAAAPRAVDIADSVRS